MQKNNFTHNHVPTKVRKNYSPITFTLQKEIILVMKIGMAEVTTKNAKKTTWPLVHNIYPFLHHLFHFLLLYVLKLSSPPLTGYCPQCYSPTLSFKVSQ